MDFDRTLDPWSCPPHPPLILIHLSIHPSIHPSTSPLEFLDTPSFPTQSLEPRLESLLLLKRNSSNHPHKTFPPCLLRRRISRREGRVAQGGQRGAWERRAADNEGACSSSLEDGLLTGGEGGDGVGVREGVDSGGREGPGSFVPPVYGRKKMYERNCLSAREKGKLLETIYLHT